MSPTANDLRRLLDDRSAEPPLTGDLAASARRRGRRRTATVWASTVAGIVVLLASTTLPLHDGPADPLLAVTLPSQDLPEFYRGGQLADVAEADLPQQELTLRFTPDDYDFFLGVDCDTFLLMRVTVNGRSAPQLSCAESTPPLTVQFPTAQRADRWAAFGVRPGAEATVRIELTNDGSDTYTIPDSGTYAIGVYDVMPFEDYPLPPRPDTLEAVGHEGFTAGVEARGEPRPVGESTRLGTWSAEVLGERATAEVPIAMPYALEFGFQTTVPGRIHVLLNGVEVLDHTGWTYSNVSGWADAVSVRLFADAPVVRRAGIEVGDQVTLTITTEYFQDPGWLVHAWTLGPP